MSSQLCHQHEQLRRDGRPLGGLDERRTHTVKTIRVPIESLSAGDRVITYDNAHVYMRGRPISSTRRFRYSGDIVRITTTGGLTSAYTPEHHCVVRFGPNRDQHVVYMMKKGASFRIGRVPMFYRSQSGTFALRPRAVAEGADAAWILSVHDTVAEASLHEALAQYGYNIPGTCFADHAHQMDVDVFWSKVGDNSAAARRCLSAYGRLIDFPLFTPGLGGRIGSKSPFVTAAANLIDGMHVLPLENRKQWAGKRDYSAPRDCWEPISVTREPYDGDIVSMEVADHHVYFADGILTHNSFTGAVDALAKFGDLPEGRLTCSWRFGQEVADAANHLLSELGDDLRVTGNPSIASQVTGAVADVDVVLTRTNGLALEQVMAAQRAGKRVHLMGDQQYALRFCEGAEKLMAGEPAGHEDLAAFTTWGQVQDHAEDSPDSSDWKTLVDLIETHGVPAVKDALARTVPESSAQLTVATAHRSKGREWNRVQLADDLADQLDSAREAVEEGGNAADRAALADELMLNYVAATRARTVLGTGRVIPPELHTRTVHPAAQAPVTPEAQPDAEAALTLPFAGTADGELVTIAIEFAPDEAARIRAVAGEKIADWLYELAMTATTDRSVA